MPSNRYEQCPSGRSEGVPEAYYATGGQPSGVFSSPGSFFSLSPPRRDRCPVEVQERYVQNIVDEVARIEISPSDDGSPHMRSPEDWQSSSFDDADDEKSDDYTDTSPFLSPTTRSEELPPDYALSVTSGSSRAEAETKYPSRRSALLLLVLFLVVGSLLGYMFGISVTPAPLSSSGTTSTRPGGPTTKLSSSTKLSSTKLSSTKLSSSSSSSGAGGGPLKYTTETSSFLAGGSINKVDVTFSPALAPPFLSTAWFVSKFGGEQDLDHSLGRDHHLGGFKHHGRGNKRKNWNSIQDHEQHVGGHNLNRTSGSSEHATSIAIARKIETSPTSRGYYAKTKQELHNGLHGVGVVVRHQQHEDLQQPHHGNHHYHDDDVDVEPQSQQLHHGKKSRGKNDAPSIEAAPSFLLNMWPPSTTIFGQHKNHNSSSAIFGEHLPTSWSEALSSFLGLSSTADAEENVPGCDASMCKASQHKDKCIPEEKQADIVKGAKKCELYRLGDGSFNRFPKIEEYCAKAMDPVLCGVDTNRRLKCGGNPSGAVWFKPEHCHDARTSRNKHLLVTDICIPRSFSPECTETRKDKVADKWHFLQLKDYCSSLIAISGDWWGYEKFQCPHTPNNEVVAVKVEREETASIREQAQALNPEPPNVEEQPEPQPTPEETPKESCCC
ncbi:unnamed protein product [Amoebophrya sp. A25]|nr:unnamed protein product [Amoebophrya sp. A25]|eukprot:GSA25T00008094001.1